MSVSRESHAADSPSAHASSRLVIGVDFDNTIVDYDAAFYVAARERDLVPASLSPTKQHVRDYLRAAGREGEWTELQGYVYGARMAAATMFPGVRMFFRSARKAHARVVIISHKTRYPYAGARYDLHAAAGAWLAEQSLYEDALVATNSSGAGAVLFELTKADKLRRIALEHCAWFIDDLPEFLAEPEFPASVRRVLFDPHRAAVDDARWDRVTSWEQATQLILGPASNPPSR